MEIWKNFLYSGYTNQKDLLLARQLFFINSYSVLGFFSAVGFGSVHLLLGNYFIALPEIIGGSVFLLIVLFLRISKHITLAKIIIVTTQGILLIVMLATGGIDHTGIYWYFTFPVVTFFLLGRGAGVIALLCLYIVTLGVFIAGSLGITSIAYTFVEVRQLLVSLLIVSTFIYLYQKAVDDTEKQVRKISVELEEYLNNMSTFTAKISLDGKILFANKIAKEASGLGEEIIGSQFLEGSWWSFDPTVKKRVSQAFREVLTGKIVNYDEKLQVATPAGLRVLTINFSMVPVFIENKMSYIVAEGRDITKLKKTEAALSEAQEIAKIGSWEWDITSGNIIWSDMMFRIMGYATIQNPVTLEKAMERIDPADQKRVQNNIQTALMQKQPGEFPMKGIEYTINIPRGKRILFGDARLLIDSTGKPHMMIGTVRDITEEKKIDRAKSEFVALASHQLRTPISAIGWFSEMLLAGDSGPITPEQKEHLSQIYQSNERMASLVNSLLNVSRLEMGNISIKPELVDLGHLSHSLLQQIIKKQKIERNLTITEKYDPHLVKLNVDPELMKVVLQNLFSNAFKYSPQNGKITIAIIPSGQKQETNAKNSNEGVLIQISDTGCGIPEGQRDKIFTKLFRADNAKAKEPDGTGLGLYIAKEILIQTGGKIWFESIENHGSTFFIWLPTTGMIGRAGGKTLIPEKEG